MSHPAWPRTLNRRSALRGDRTRRSGRGRREEELDTMRAEAPEKSGNSPRKPFEETDGPTGQIRRSRRWQP